MNTSVATLVLAVASAALTVAAEAAPLPPAASLGSAIVVQDQASLRAAPRDGAQQQASLWQGEVLEVRGERLDYLQVWDHKRERGGFIRAADVRRVALTEAEAPALLAVMRFVQETPGAEALGIGLAAAYLQAAPARALAVEEGAQAFDAWDYLQKTTFEEADFIETFLDILRTTQAQAPASAAPAPVGDALVLDPLWQRTPTWRGERINLPLTAQRILATLHQRSGEVVSYDELFEVVKSGRNRDNVRKHVSTIREALREVDPGFEGIENVPMRGFRWTGK